MKQRHGQYAAAGLLAGIFAMGAAIVGIAQSAQLPEGPGKVEMTKMCSTCHPAERAASVRLTRAGWQDVMTKMVGLGAKGTDAELEATLTYLATNFKGEAGKPLNLNTATSVDLESIAGFLRKESAAWIQYRAKQGPCKAIDDLKKAPGVDFKKVEERRERLVCF
jgi:competence protein ComEA